MTDPASALHGFPDQWDPLRERPELVPSFNGVRHLPVTLTKSTIRQVAS